MTAEYLLETATLIRADCPIPKHAHKRDFIDYPTGWALQRAGVSHLETCSAELTDGAMLCDCRAIYARWREWKALLALADLLDRAAGGHDETPCPAIDGLMAVAQAYRSDG